MENISLSLSEAEVSMYTQSMVTQNIKTEFNSSKPYLMLFGDDLFGILWDKIITDRLCW